MSSHDYVYIVTETPINLLEVDLSPATYEATYAPLSSPRCLVLTGGSLSAAVEAVRAIYPDARATTSAKEAGEWLKQRHITPHKGGRTIKRSTDVTPETQAALEELRQAGISLGDLVEEAAQRKLSELRTG